MTDDYDFNALISLLPNVRTNPIGKSYINISLLDLSSKRVISDITRNFLRMENTSEHSDTVTIDIDVFSVFRYIECILLEDHSVEELRGILPRYVHSEVFYNLYEYDPNIMSEFLAIMVDYMSFYYIYYSSDKYTRNNYTEARLTSKCIKSRLQKDFKQLWKLYDKSEISHHPFMFFKTALRCFSPNYQNYDIVDRMNTLFRFLCIFYGGSIGFPSTKLSINEQWIEWYKTKYYYHTDEDVTVKYVYNEDNKQKESKLMKGFKNVFK